MFDKIKNSILDIASGSIQVVFVEYIYGTGKKKLHQYNTMYNKVC